MKKQPTVIKMYINYNFLGQPYRLDFEDFRPATGVPADRVEVEFLPEVSETIISDELDKAIHYKGYTYVTSNLHLQPDGRILLKTYQKGDAHGNPSGKVITIGAISEEQMKKTKLEAMRMKAQTNSKQKQGKSRSR